MRYLTLVFLGCVWLLAAPRAVSAQSLFGSMPIDGIQCESAEGAREHIHVQLEIYDRGSAVQVPALVGIPMSGTCLYWVHTHAANGIIHIESPVIRTFTLGQFFDIWGMDLGPAKVGGLTASRGHTLQFNVNGSAYKGDPRAIPLRDHETIVIQRGPPYATPVKPDWSKI